MRIFLIALLWGMLLVGCVSDIPKPVPLPPEPVVCPEGDRISAVEKEVADLRAAFEEFKAKQESAGNGSAGSKLSKQLNIPSNYKPRWVSRDGLSLRDHAKIHHHIDTEGLTDAEVAFLRDLDHDRYGSGHSHIRR